MLPVWDGLTGLGSAIRRQSRPWVQSSRVRRPGLCAHVHSNYRGLVWEKFSLQLLVCLNSGCYTAITPVAVLSNEVRICNVWFLRFCFESDSMLAAQNQATADEVAQWKVMENIYVDISMWFAPCHSEEPAGASSLYQEDFPVCLRPFLSAVNLLNPLL